jgi:hypothetical protein
MANIIPSLFLLPMAVAVWAMFCNRRTHTQKKVLINRVFAHPDWRRLHGYLDQVSYDRHLLALMLCRDPMKLYHPKIVELMSRARVGVREAEGDAL